MKSTTVLDNLQKLIETAEIISSVIPDEAINDVWVHESIDNALGELERITTYLKDKYELDMFDMDDEDDPEYLTSSEFDSDPFLNDDDYNDEDDYDDFDFDDDDDE